MRIMRKLVLAAVCAAFLAATLEAHPHKGAQHGGPHGHHHHHAHDQGKGGNAAHGGKAAHGQGQAGGGKKGPNADGPVVPQFVAPKQGKQGGGRWTNKIRFPLSPAAAVLLPERGGDVCVVWSSFEPYRFEQFGNSKTATAVLSLKTLTVGGLEVVNTNHDMFCPGIASRSDGTAVITGGSGSAGGKYSAQAVTTVQGGNGKWDKAPWMNIGRAYHSSCTLADQSIFVIGGSWAGGRGGKYGEVWRQGQNFWTKLPGCKVEPLYTQDQDGVYRQDNHAWLFAWFGNSVFQAGPSKQMNWYFTDGDGGVKGAGRRTYTDQMNGNAVMYDEGRILTLGGAPNYEDLSKKRPGYAATKAVTAANIIMLPANAGGQVQVKATGQLNKARAFCTSVALPTGDVLTLGGQYIPVPFSDATASLQPEIWRRAQGRFDLLAAAPTPRTYHSWSLLLPDARVISGGGGLCAAPYCGNMHNDADIFEPPYLFNPDGSPAKRPKITNAPGKMAPGGKLTITVDMPVQLFCVIRYGSSTHAIDTDQRRLELKITGKNGNKYDVVVPRRGSLIPGTYMLFAVLPTGTPSVSQRIVF